MSAADRESTVESRLDLTIRTKFVARLNPSKAEVRNLSPETEVSFLPMDAIGEDGKLRLDEVRPLGDVIDGYSYVAEDDVVIAKITPCFENGKGAVASGLTNRIAFATTEVIPIRCLAESNPRFLWYQLSCDPFRSMATGAMYGAGGQKRVPDSFVANYRLALPIPDEQRAISDFLDRETAKIDTLIEKQERLIELLEEKRQAVITRAVTKGLNPDVRMKDSGVEWLGEVPEHWTVFSLDKAIDPLRRITYGIVQPGEADPTGRFMIRGQDYSRGWADPESVFRVSDVIEVPYRRARLKPGDVVMTIVGAGVGNTAIVPEWLDGANITQTTARLAPSANRCTNRYLLYLMSSDAGRTQIGLSTKGAAQPGLNLGHIAKYRFAFPPIGEQEGITAALDAELTVFDRIGDQCRAAMSLLRERRTALISAAVTGKIDVRQAV